MNTFQKKLQEFREAYAKAMEPQAPTPIKPKPSYLILDKLGVVYDDLTDEQKEFIDDKRSQVAAGKIINLNDLSDLYTILDQHY